MPYQPGLDGLRALSVVAVVLYHAELPVMQGGFLGVEVFFVLSGYLITSLLLREHARTGRLDLIRFAVRRTKRLLPAVWVLLLAVLATGVLALPEILWSLRRECLAALAHVANWYQLASGQSYFDHSGRPSLLRHLWSLAIEEQFYVLWPVALWGALRLGGLCGARVVACVLTLGSMIWALSLHAPELDGSQVYLHSGARAAGLLAGALFALWTTREPSVVVGGFLRPVVLESAGAFALLALLASFAWLSETEPLLYTGGFWSVDVATLVLLAASTHPGTRGVRAWLSHPWLAALGRRSYSLYLWHWPLFMVTRPGVDVQLSAEVALLPRLVLSLFLAELSFRFVEQPVRDGRLARALGGLLPRQPASRATFVVSLVAAMLLAALPFGRAVVAAQRPHPKAWQLELWSQSRAQAAADEGRPTSETEPTPDPARALAAVQSLSAMLPLPSAASLAPEPDANPTFDEARLDPRRSRAPEVLALGDSVMLGAARGLKHHLGRDVVVDARVSRAAKHLLTRLEARRAADRLGRTVLIHIGNNLRVTRAQLTAMLAQLETVERVVLVTVRVPRRWQSSNNAALRETAAQHPRVALADWFEASEGHPEYFREDGYHLTLRGARAYAGLLHASL